MTTYHSTTKALLATVLCACGSTGNTNVGQGQTGTGTESESGTTDTGTESESGTTDTGTESESESESGATDTGEDTTTGDGDSDTGCEGQLDCECAPNETCVDDLLCVQGTCVAPSCGDGIVSNGETCDDGNVTNSDGCNSDCQATEIVELQAGGFHTCALFNSGEARCWGRGNTGQLGQGNTNIIGDAEDPSSVPPIVLAAPITSIRTGYQHTCALLETGQVVCWGYANQGQLGYGNTNAIGDDELPAVAGPVPLGGVAVAIDLGPNHTCALLDTGYPICWGQGHAYQLGQQGTDNIGDNETPGSVPVINVNGESSRVFAGGSQTCALRDDDELICWGHNAYGQLGLVSQSSQIHISQAPQIPAQIPRPPLDLSMSSEHTCAIFQDTYQLACWGYYQYGRLGYPGQAQDIGDDEAPGNPVAIGGTPIDVATGDGHSCAVLDDGGVVCWGYGASGQLGYGNTANIGDNETPASAGTVAIGGPAVMITAGQAHTCALREDNEVVCWGEGQWGALGYGNPAKIGDNETPESAGTVEVY